MVVFKEQSISFIKYDKETDTVFFGLDGSEIQIDRQKVIDIFTGVNSGFIDFMLFSIALKLDEVGMLEDSIKYLKNLNLDNVVLHSGLYKEVDSKITISNEISSIKNIINTNKFRW